MICKCALTKVLAGSDDDEMTTPQDRASIMTTGILIGQVLGVIGPEADAEYIIDHLLGHAAEDVEQVAAYSIHNATGLLSIARQMRTADGLKN